MNSLVYEAKAWIKDVVYGCVSVEPKVQGVCLDDCLDEPQASRHKLNKVQNKANALRKHLSPLYIKLRTP